jgi:hypothetical protein
VLEKTLVIVELDVVVVSPDFLDIVCDIAAVISRDCVFIGNVLMGYIILWMHE